MIICVTPEDLARDRKPQYGGRLIQMFGDRSVPWDGPCGHLVRQSLEDAVPPHFHEADQYQIFIEGRGRVGGHEVRTGSIHYSDGYGGYGPIEAGPEGCAYLTLRPRFDTSHHPLPRDAKLAKGRKGQQHMANMDLASNDHDGLTTLFHRPDGVAAHQLRVAAGKPAPAIDVAGGSYWLVLKGQVIIDGRDCPMGTCLWVGETDARPAMTAGDEGATLAVMCFADRHSQAARGVLAA